MIERRGENKTTKNNKKRDEETESERWYQIWYRASEIKRMYQEVMNYQTSRL